VRRIALSNQTNDLTLKFYRLGELVTPPIGFRFENHLIADAAKTVAMPAVQSAGSVFQGGGGGQGSFSVCDSPRLVDSGKLI
jgi:hypothetical protein